MKGEAYLQLHGMSITLQSIQGGFGIWRQQLPCWHPALPAHGVWLARSHPPALQDRGQAQPVSAHWVLDPWGRVCLGA